MAEIDDLLKACTVGDIERAGAILAADRSLASGANMFGATPLHAAYFAGHADIVWLLRSRGARLDGFALAELDLADELGAVLQCDPGFARAWNRAGATALHGACYWGGIATARLLLDRGANASAATRDGFLQIHPLGSAVATPDIPNPAQGEDNVLALVELLLEHGADVNARRRDGMTALHTAAYRGLLNVIARLIAAGADPAIRSHEGGFHSNETPRDTALSQGQIEAAELLAR
ncbi:MAG: ankyrin repeat domain-containing protein [Rhizomicrobium sp.]